MRVGPNWYGSFCKRNMNFTKIDILLDSKFKKLNSQDEFKDLQRTSEYDGQKKMTDTNLSKNVHYSKMGYVYPSVGPKLGFFSYQDLQ